MVAIVGCDLLIFEWFLEKPFVNEDQRSLFHHEGMDWSHLPLALFQDAQAP